MFHLGGALSWRHGVARVPSVKRLANETSPYLRQHADNPVDWWPWGDEAFAEARNTDRPILLSVGYSACHWCHVMAHESFENPETAEIMNAGFVNVKIDREERPDIDSIYMDALTSLTGRGGWPMTVFCYPDGRPFHAGTYWPDQPRGGMPSFSQVLNEVSKAWNERRSDLEQLAEKILPHMARSASSEPQGQPAPDAIEEAVETLLSHHDEQWGGFGGAPKFPPAMSLDVLLRLLSRQPHPAAQEALTTTLDAMASGGIYDHLDGGFSRYSVDEQWLVPHFEKMLYDNALLARTYLHAWQVVGHQRWRQVTEETISYVLRRLTQPGGGFASAEDADSEGVEGQFFVWSTAEIEAVCGPDAPAALDWYGATETGNFEGSNILFRPRRGELMRPTQIENARRSLLAQREKRVRPGLDDKVITEWNGLMLATLAEAAAALDRPDWLRAAQENADFLCTHLHQGQGRWLRSWQADGGARQLGFAADHAAMIDALVRLSEATGEARWIEVATQTADVLLELFSDPERGGFFSTGSDAPALVARPKEVMDNALPSANSLAAGALLRLGALTGEDRYLEAAEGTLALFGAPAAAHATAFGHLLGAVDMHLTGLSELVIPGTRPDLLTAVRSTWRPNLVLSWGEPLSGPLWEGRQEGLAYLCQNFSCRAPVSTPEDLLEALEKH